MHKHQICYFFYNMKRLKLEHFIALGGKSQNMAQIEGFVFQSLENHPGRRRKLCLTKFSPSSSTMFTKAYNLRIMKKKKLGLFVSGVQVLLIHAIQNISLLQFAWKSICAQAEGIQVWLIVQQ